MQNFTTSDVAVLALELIPAVAFGFAGERVARPASVAANAAHRLAGALHTALCLISFSHQIFLWRWFAVYAVIPIAVAWLLARAAAADPEQHGNWRDAIILLALGLAVDLRWLERLWPHGLAGLGKLLLVDAASTGSS